MKKLTLLIAFLLASTLVVLASVPDGQGKPDSAKQAKLDRQAAEKRQKAADQWVARTMAKMTLDEKIDQLIFTSLNAAYTSTDSEACRANRCYGVPASR